MKKAFRTLLLSVIICVAAACTQNPKFEKFNQTFFFADEFNVAELKAPENKILFGIDNSRSMADEIAALKVSLQGLSTQLAALGIDYTIYLSTIAVPATTFSNHPYDKDESGGATRTANGPSYTSGTPTSMDSANTWLNNLVVGDFSIEPGIHQMSKLLYSAFGSKYKTSGKLDNAHIVVMSDEDNTRAYQGTILLQPSHGKKFNYYYNYKAGTRRAQLSSRKLCMLAGNPNGYNKASYNQMVYCKDPSSTASARPHNPWREKSFNPANRYEFCTEPKDYICDIDVDGNKRTGQEVSYYHNSTCQPKNVADTERTIVAIDSRNPHMTACVVATCSKDAYIAFRRSVTRTGGVIAPIEDACDGGYVAEPEGFYYLLVDETGENLVVQNPLPDGVTRTTDFSALHYSDRWMTEEEGLQTVRAEVPGATDVTPSNFPRRPPAQDEIRPPVLATPAGFDYYRRRYFGGAKVTFHSIVNLDGEACSDSDQNNNKIGADYIDLSDRTGGVKQSICNPSQSLSTFMTKFVESIVKNNRPSYELQSEIDLSEGRLIVTLLKAGRILADTDYELINNKHIRIKANVNTVGERVRVEFKPNDTSATP